jgi:hypothetical protein
MAFLPMTKRAPAFFYEPIARLIVFATHWRVQAICSLGNAYFTIKSQT